MIDYRKAGVQDIQALIDLRVEFVKEVMGIQDDPRETELRNALFEYFSDLIPKDEFVAWVAVDDGRIIATSGLIFYRRPPSFKNMGGKAAYIMNMYTQPPYRGRGIIKVLLSKIIEEAKARGYHNISLNATEMGRPIYEKFGFTLSGDEMVLIVK